MYRYYTPFRPPMPGAIPRGAANVNAFDEREYVKEINREAWGYADYARPLTDKEVKDYELMPDTDQLRTNMEQYKGYVIQYNPILNLFDVWQGGALIACTTTMEEAKEGIDTL